MIAIIAILSAILFPVFAKAREKARQASCQSNEKQIGLAILQYVQDNDETFPGDSVPLSTTSGHGGWAGAIYPYVKSTALYKCPDDSTPPKNYVNANNNNAAVTAVPISYAFNLNLNNSFGSTGALASLGAPASTVLLTEVQNFRAEVTNPANDPLHDSTAGWLGSDAANGGDGGPGWNDHFAENNSGQYVSGPNVGGTGMGSPPRTGYNGHLAGPRHTDGSNFLLGDGHVKYLRPSQVSPGVNNGNTNCTQDTGNNGDCAQGLTGLAAGTSYMGQGTEKFAATFSAI